jgi:hypothetical protein
MPETRDMEALLLVQTGNSSAMPENSLSLGLAVELDRGLGVAGRQDRVNNRARLHGATIAMSAVSQRSIEWLKRKRMFVFNGN